MANYSLERKEVQTFTPCRPYSSPCGGVLSIPGREDSPVEMAGIRGATPEGVQVHGRIGNNKFSELFCWEARRAGALPAIPFVFSRKSHSRCRIDQRFVNIGLILSDFSSRG